jgi:indole-3-acetate monooxygenase
MKTNTQPQQDLLANANGLALFFRANAEANEANGALTDEVVDALHDAGFFGMWVPRVLGGSELDPLTSLDVIETLSYADASTGWVVLATALSTGTAGAYISDEATSALFSGPRFPVIAGQGSRPGKAEPVTGGYRLSGQWAFASGVKHAQYIHTAAVVQGGPPLIFVLPTSAAQFKDTWDVLGLRATGSIDYDIDDVFVPEEYVHPQFMEEPVRGGDIYRLGAVALVIIGHTGWALGVGRRILDEVAALAVSKTGRPGQLVDSDSFHSGFAQAEAQLRSARAFAHESWQSVVDGLKRGELPTVRQKTLLRLALNHATWTTEQISVFAYAASGTSALYAGTMQRLFRDVHAGTQHITSSPAALQAAGRELSGLAPGEDWANFSLVAPS